MFEDIMVYALENVAHPTAALVKYSRVGIVDVPCAVGRRFAEVAIDLEQPRDRPQIDDLTIR